MEDACRHLSVQTVDGMHVPLLGQGVCGRMAQDIDNILGQQLDGVGEVLPLVVTWGTRNPGDGGTGVELYRDMPGLREECRTAVWLLLGIDSTQPEGVRLTREHEFTITDGGLRKGAFRFFVVGQTDGITLLKSPRDTVDLKRIGLARQ